MVLVRRQGTPEDERLDPFRLKKIDGVWRSIWQRRVRAEMAASDPLCRRCRLSPGTQIHHTEPVHVNPARAFDPTNVTLLCDDCHDEMHRTQGWQTGHRLYGAAVRVQDIVIRGREKTFDLEIAGPYPNFLANGVVVHNSRNSASSRAIPVEKRIASIEADPFVPESFGSAKAGMQAGEALTDQAASNARSEWLWGMHQAISAAKGLSSCGVHKQLANRLLEPFAWHTAVITATDWRNFFALRCHPDAQPEFRRIAEMMRDAMTVSDPVRIERGTPFPWHVPFIRPEDWTAWGDGFLSSDDMLMVSVGRCARVSYLTHDGKLATHEGR